MAGLKITSSLKACLEDADVALDWDSCGFQNQLLNGILLSKGTKKFLLDKITYNYTIIFFARALQITWIEDPRYWKWTIMNDSCGNSIEVAQLIEVCWFNIVGKISALKLTPRIEYEVVFVILIKSCASGLELPFNLSLKVLNHCPQTRQVCLLTFPREEWVEILVGSFTLSDNDICGCGDIEFSMFEHGGHWKKGMLIKSAIIRSKQLC